MLTLRIIGETLGRGKASSFDSVIAGAQAGQSELSVKGDKSRQPSLAFSSRLNKSQRFDSMKDKYIGHGLAKNACRYWVSCIS
jgi:hypothetical protein